MQNFLVFLQLIKFSTLTLGYGVFAKANIERGKPLLEYSGEHLSKSAAEEGRSLYKATNKALCFIYELTHMSSEMWYVLFRICNGKKLLTKLLPNFLYLNEYSPDSVHLYIIFEFLRYFSILKEHFLYF